MEELTSKEAAAERSTVGKLPREENQSVNAYIAIKGTRNGLLLTLEPGTPFSELLNALADRISEAPSFFRGASLSVDTTHRSLHSSERSQLENLLAHYHMSVAPIETKSVETKPVADRRRGANTTITLPPPDSSYEGVAVTKEIEQAQRDGRDTEDTLFLRRTVRSGQAIHHHSNVVVLGDVNPGAEIVAGGDIIVWGVLRGMVHAGYPENDAALVCALQLTPVQLRVSRLLSRPPEGFEAQPRPEVASIKQGQIVVETWSGGGRPSRR
ncbi:MAG: septum site-determining protein MinC [Ktedonobacteraceae bacterium]